MFDVFCPPEQTRVLLFVNNIEAIRNTPDAIEIHFRCPCGHRGVWRTGLRHRPALDKNLTLATGCN